MSRREERALVIVGGGLAGLAAAAEASRAGLETTLVEQRTTLRGPRRLISEATTGGAEIRLETAAWGIWGRDLALWNPAGASVITADHVILATGALERPAAFPGWTLPGVMTAAGARRLMEQGVSPGQRVLVAGYGHWVASIAAELRAGGVNIVDVVDATSTSGRIVLCAEGDRSIERAAIARAATDGSTRAGSERVVEINALVLAWGLLPENQLARLAGCTHTESTYLEPSTVRDAWMRTSAAGVLVAGDAGGIRGPDVAVEQGRLAGLAAAVDAGLLNQNAAETRAQAARRRLAAVGAAESFAAPPPAGLYTLANPDTVVCRCEDVTLGAITERLFDGSIEPGPVIAETRATMGVCQGRHCASLLAAVISRYTGVPMNSVPPVTPRPPVVPVPLGALAERPPEFEPLPVSA
jgi:thioredoxin reductase